MRPTRTTEPHIQTYFQLFIRKLPRHLEDDVTYLCVENGAQGVSQVLPFKQDDQRYNPEIIELPEIDLSAFFDQRPSKDLLKALVEFVPADRLEILEKPHEDWMEEWKKHFKPFQLVGPFWIVPSWLTAPSEAEIILRIDPGMAFGTGTHATTQIASTLLYQMRERLGHAESVLDVGTGTSVLALISSYLGARRVDATEIDPIARETAQENVGHNSRSNVHVLEIQIDQLQKPYDLVIANIIDGVLMDLKSDLIRLAKPGGRLLLTGILEDRKDEFLIKFLANTDLEIETSMQKDEWWGFVLRGLS